MLISNTPTSSDQHAPKTYDGGRRPLRLALFSGNYNYVMDGPVRALNRLVAHLEARGVEVLVFAPTTSRPVLKHAGTLVSVPSVPIPSRSEYRVALGLPRSVRKKLDAFSPDIVHLAAPDLLGRAALKYAKQNDLPAVASFHTRFDTYLQYYGVPKLGAYLTSYLRRFYAQCEHVYVPCDSMADELRRDGLAHNLRIWSRGVDRRVFTPAHRSQEWRSALGFTKDDVVITFVGRLVLEKGLRMFADAIKVLEQRDVAHRVLIVGEGPERDQMESWLPNAVFAGFQKDLALGRAYASSDLFFNPSITETFGNVTLEAMACGLPAVCADATGSRSLVDPGKTGYLAQPDRPEAFADHLERLIMDDALRRRMHHASLKRAEAYEWDVILDGLLDDYKAVVSGSPAQAVHRDRSKTQEPLAGFEQEEMAPAA